jgi:hypothetical protein
MIPPFRPRRAGLQSRLWREAARAFFQHVANPTLPVEVRRRRLERVSRFNWLPSGTHVEPVVAGAPHRTLVARLVGVQNGATVTDVPVVNRGAAWAHWTAVMMPSRDVTPPGPQPLV